MSASEAWADLGGAQVVDLDSRRPRQVRPDFTHRPVPEHRHKIPRESLDAHIAECRQLLEAGRSRLGYVTKAARRGS